MAYLFSYGYDVFLSYAHGPPPIDRLGAWSRQLREDLYKELAHRLGTKDPNRLPAIWMDPSLSGNSRITDEIIDVVRRSAVLVVIMSRFSFVTPWMTNEIAWFSEGAERSGGPAGRIFVVRAEPTKEALWPKGLRDTAGHVLKGYEFYSTPPGADEPETFGWYEADNPDYRRAVGKLARDIARKLEEMPDQTKVFVEAAPGRPAPRSAARPAAPGGRTVFLGLMHDTIEVRDDLRRSLEGGGLSVVPELADDPVDEASLRAAFTKYLPSADAMILAANQYPGAWPKGQPGGFVSLQIDKAKERDIPCYLLLQEDTFGAIKRPEYRDYLAALQRAPGRLVARQDDVGGFAEHIIRSVGATKRDDFGDDPERVAVICVNAAPDPDVGDSFTAAIFSVLDELKSDSFFFDFSERNDEQIELTDLSKRIRQAGAILVVCFDQDWDWAKPFLKQINRLDPDMKSRLLIAGPRDLRRGVFNGGVARFRTINGMKLDTERLKEVLRREIFEAEARSPSGPVH
jgi:hypothetical protein